MKRQAIVVLVVAACSDLPPYVPECGNGVIDVHEDCDAPEGCLQCALPCTADASCPEGLACGGDAVCHAPGGHFRSEPQSLPFNADELFVADVDADRVGDVIGVGATSLLVHKGVLYSGPGPSEVVGTPFVTGPAAIGHFDATDGSTDVVLPTAQSLVAYTSPQHALSPDPFALDVSHMNAAPIGVFAIDPLHVGVIGTHQSTPGMFYATIDISTGMPVFENDATVCSSLSPSAVTSFELHDASAPGTPQMFVALSGGGQGCLLEVTLGAQGYFATEITQLSGGGRLVLAAITPGTACPSMLDGLTQYPASGSAGSCDFQRTTGTTLRAVPLTQLTSSGYVTAADEVAIGGVPLSPGIAGYAPEALATSYGIYALSGSSALRLYHADRLLDSVRALDIDGDGDLDVAASAAGFDDVDLLYRFHPPTGFDGFQLVRYDTVAHPRLMFAGDFDGNQIADLAYIERLAYGDRLMVAYGTTDRPLAPIEMATFHDVVSMLPGFLDATDPSGTLGDLTVLDYDPASQRPTMTLLHGSPQRTLVPNFDPRPPPMGPPAMTSAAPTFVGVAFGHFGGSGAIADLFSVINDAGAVTTYLSQAADGAFSVVNTAPPAATGFAVCGASAVGQLCANRAHYLTWARQAGTDLLIAVEDAFGRASTFDPSAPTALTLTSDLVTGDVPEALSVHSLQRFDVDGDGSDELVAAFGHDLHERIASPVGEVLACRVDAAGVFHAGDCTDLSTAVADADGEAVCVDASAGIVRDYQMGAAGTPPAAQLVIVCHRPQVGKSDVFAISHDEHGFHADRLLRVPATVERIFLGDVNGDAAADLLALDVDPLSLVPTLRVYVQCTSRDVEPECVQ